MRRSLTAAMLAVAVMLPSLGASGANVASPTPLAPGVDILGVKPGQDAATVRLVLARAEAAAGDKVYYAEGHSPSRGGEYVSSAIYARLREHAGSSVASDLDIVRVAFSAPEQGNMVLAVKRVLRYPDARSGPREAQDEAQALNERLGMGQPFSLGVPHFVHMRNVVVLEADGTPRPRAGTRDADACGVVASSEQGSDRLDAFDPACGSAVLSWDIIGWGYDERSVRMEVVEIKDVALGLAARFNAGLQVVASASSRPHPRHPMQGLAQGGAPPPATEHYVGVKGEVCDVLKLFASVDRDAGACLHP